MDNPGWYSGSQSGLCSSHLHTVTEIPTVIRLLTQSPPSLQKKAINRFFTRNAAFVHPFCRVPSYEGSRWLVTKIFQWYKIMSPGTEIEVHSVGECAFIHRENSDC